MMFLKLNFDIVLMGYNRNKLPQKCRGYRLLPDDEVFYYFVRKQSE